MMNRYVVIKCGGSTVNELTDAFYERLKTIQQSGKQLVVVHGGGSDVNDMLELMNVKVSWINGLRRTTPEVLAVADMVFNGKVNPKICSELQQAGVKSVGLSGCDGPMITAELLDERNLGLVGKAVHVDTTLIEEMVRFGLTPVISPIVASTNGQRLNMNADTAASHYAKSLGAEEVIFVTNVPGIMQDGKVIESVTEDEVQELISEGVIYGGMIPKVEAAIASLSDSVKTVTIIGASADEKGTAIKRSAVRSV